MQKRKSGMRESKSAQQTLPEGQINRRSALMVPLLSALSGGLASAPGLAHAQETGGSRRLVAYLSRSGNTRVIAGEIKRRYHADLFEIRTAVPYPEDYEEMVAWASRLRETQATPPLAASVADIKRYETIFLGFPIWGGALPAPVQTFLTKHDLSGKTIAPFITHGGYGPGSAPSTLSELAPRAKILKPLVLKCDQERDTLNPVSVWLRDVESGK